MNTKLVFVCAALVLSLAFTGSAVAQEEGVIADYCEEVVDNVADTADELAEANADLANCFDEYDDCLNGFIDKEPVKCISDFAHCISVGKRDQTQACDLFLRQFKGDTRRAFKSARRRSVENEFLLWFHGEESDVCLDPARATSLLCASFTDD